MVSLEGVAGTALDIGIMVISIVLIGGAMIGATLLYLKWKKYNEFACIIYQRDGFGQLCQKKDSAGIFVDSKTKNKRFFLKRSNIGMNPDNVPFISSSRGKKTVYLLQTGLKNFHYINLTIPASNQFKLTVGEEDANWAINAYERQKKLFSQSLLMQLMPFIALAFVAVIILTIFIYFFKDFDVLATVATELKGAAQAIAQANAGTTVIPT